LIILKEIVLKRQKTLELIKEFCTLVHDELYYLDQKEEIEISRDWSMPEKLDSYELTLFKNVLPIHLSRSPLIFTFNPLFDIY
jgi:hypothetical protein